MTPDRIQIGIAVFGASLTLAGLSLVFLGFALSTYQSYPGDTGEQILTPYRGAAWAMACAFALGLLVALASLAWLTTSCTILYPAFLSLLVVQIVVVLVSALVITSLVLRQ